MVHFLENFCITLFHKGLYDNNKLLTPNLLKSSSIVRVKLLQYLLHNKNQSHLGLTMFIQMIEYII